MYVGADPVATTYTPLGAGWYRMNATVTGTTSAQNYGVYVHAGKTVYLDNLSLIPPRLPTYSPMPAWTRALPAGRMEMPWKIHLPRPYRQR